MPVNRPVEDSRTQETWKIASEGTCWVWIYDKREDKYKKQRVGGAQGGSKTLHISTDDRRFNQEQVVDENKHLDPFTNGLLQLVSKDGPDDIDTTYHLSAADLKAIIKIDEASLFEAEVTAIGSELVLRRLLEIAETDATVGQLAFVKNLVDSRYKTGGTQRSVAEMIKAGEELSGTQLS